MERISNSAKDTLQMGKDFGSALKSGLICLYGPLGAGKTVFVRGVAEGLGVASRIQSPTFTYQRVHKGKNAKLYHFDCYRVSKPDMLLFNDLHEALERNDGPVVVEWAEKVENFLPKERIEIHIEYGDGDNRKISIKNI